MKLALFTTLVCGVSAFAPVQQTAFSGATSGLRMSEEAEPAAEVVPEPVVAAPAVVEQPWPYTPFIFPNFFFGEGVWDKLTTEWGSAETGKFIKAAEIKHGRAAMLGALGFAQHKLGLTLDKLSIHDYLSVTHNIKFADLQAMKPVDAIFATPVEGLAQMFVFVAAIEIYELTHRDGEIKYGESVAPGLQAGGLTGDIGWNPLKFTVTDKLKLQEIQNGRAAMVAISAFVAADTIPGSVPFPLLW